MKNQDGSGMMIRRNFVRSTAAAGPYLMAAPYVSKGASFLDKP